MLKIYYNVGLGNNPLEFENVVAFIRAMYPKAVTVMAVVNTGEWEGEIEYTIVAEVITEGSWSDRKTIKEATKSMAEAMNQDAIAVEVEDNRRTKGWLIYTDHYDGKRDKFDKKYFIKF